MGIDLSLTTRQQCIDTTVLICTHTTNTNLDWRCLASFSTKRIACLISATILSIVTETYRKFCYSHRDHLTVNIVIRKEGNVLFNDALNTFYLQLYGVGHMVKDHSDSERGNPLPPHGYSFRLSTRVLLYAPSHRQDSI